MPQFSYQHPAAGNTPPEYLQSIAEFIQRGPCIDVEIHVPDVIAQQLQAAKQPIPAVVTGKGLFDTGASISGIDEGHAASLGLTPVATSQVSTPHGTQTRNVYSVKLAFPGTVLPAVPILFTTGSEIKNQGIDVLIGRDYLTDKVLIYNGPMRLYTLCY